MTVNAAGQRRSMVVDHRSMVVDHNGDRWSTVAVNDGRRWQTIVDCRWTTVDHHRTTDQRWLVGWSSRVKVGSGSGLPHGPLKECHVAQANDLHPRQAWGSILRPCG
nr:hypothetical protein [Tanacetum cinerariifolium]